MVRDPAHLSVAMERVVSACRSSSRPPAAGSVSGRARRIRSTGWAVTSSPAEPLTVDQHCCTRRHPNTRRSFSVRATFDDVDARSKPRASARSISFSSPNAIALRPLCIRLSRKSSQQRRGSPGRSSDPPPQRGHACQDSGSSSDWGRHRWGHPNRRRPSPPVPARRRSHTMVRHPPYEPSAHATLWRSQVGDRCRSRGRIEAPQPQP